MRRDFLLPHRGEGALAAFDYGPRDQPVDLIFLHANGFNALTYRRILGPLAAGFRVLAVDQRGHGTTTLPTRMQGRTDWLDFRDDILGLLERLDSREVVLAGHSMGGTAALMAAAKAPDRVRRLVLFDPVIMPAVLPQGHLTDSPLHQGALRRRAEFPSRHAALEAYRGRGAFATWPNDILADYVAGGFRDLPGGGVRLACDPAWEASSYASHDHDARGAFGLSVCPIAVLRAETGSTCRIDDEIVDLTADGRIAVETVPGTTHFLPMERPDLATSTLAGALART